MNCQWTALDARRQPVGAMLYAENHTDNCSAGPKPGLLWGNGICAPNRVYSIVETATPMNLGPFS